jgi:diguanylate cyclase (GGDEF)-like protein
MQIRVAGRYDSLLLGGLAVATLFLFGRTIQYLLDIAREVELRQGMALLPALVVLTVVFVFHQNMKRQAANAQALAHAAEAEQAQARARELESLVACGRGVARALTSDALREALWRHVPQLVGMRDVAIYSYDGAAWEELIGGACVSREAIVRLVAEHGSDFSDSGSGLTDGVRGLYMPLLVGARLVGWIAAPAGGAAWSKDARQLLEAIAAPVAIAIRNVQLFRDLEKTAMIDALTGCYTRGYGDEMIDIELRRAKRSHMPVSILMFDVDKFKSINDRFGHLAGDAVLSAIGRRLSTLLRRTDIRCRYGGDEFLIVLPDTPTEAATHVATNLAREIERLAISSGTDQIAVTISVGVAPAYVGELDVTALINRADEALYLAKAAGRNCVRATPLGRTEMPAARAPSFTTTTH